MPLRTAVRTLVVVLALSPLATAQGVAKSAPVKPSAEDRQKVRTEADKLAIPLATLKSKGVHADLIADVEIYQKAAAWMDRLDEYAGKGDVAMVVDQVATGLSRAESLKGGASPWTTVAGSVVRAYRSKVDGSVQPYAVEIPTGLDLTKPSRLDVVLHGRNDGLNEARFIKSHEGKTVPADRPYLTLHVFGRTNNGYRWAGETDVFEAIDAVKRNYKVDEDRVVLRGFSMGGAGAWHLGLHYPSMWAAVEAGAGFTETIRYAKIPPNTVPAWQFKAMRIYDAVDYATNTVNVPIVAYGGEDDHQLQASTNILEALAKVDTFKTDGLVTRAETLPFLRVIGKGMGHKVDPASRTIINAFVDEHAKEGLKRTPRTVSFHTETLAYNRSAWFSIERLTQHYFPTYVLASLNGDVIDDNVARLWTGSVDVIGVDRQVAEKVSIDGKTLPLRLAAKGLLPKVFYRKTAEGWDVLDHELSIVLIDGLDGSKNPAVHGPIDDAFRGAFLVVTPTGTPWHPEVDTWAKARLDRFTADWERYLRGNIRVKRDVDVTDADIAENHLILFGDPGSNALLSKVLKGLPIGWSKEKFSLSGDHDSGKFVPLLIAPNPLNPKRYIVVNTGHTFESSDFTGTNALLFPRLGDWAVVKIGEGGQGSVETSGFFDERWRVK